MLIHTHSSTRTSALMQVQWGQRSPNAVNRRERQRGAGLRVDRAGILRGYRGGTGGPGRWSPGSSGSEPGLSSFVTFLVGTPQGQTQLGTLHGESKGGGSMQ